MREIQTAKNTDEAFRSISRAVAAAQSAEEKALITKAAFGARMIGLVRVLDLGEKGLARTAEKARDLGLVIEKDMLDNAEALQNEFGVASRVIDLNFKKALVELSPIIVSTTKGFSGMVRGLADFSTGVREFFSYVAKLKSVEFGDRNVATEFLGDPNEFLKNFQLPLEKVGAFAESGFLRAQQAGIKWETTTKDNIDALKEAENRARAFGETVGDAFFRATAEGENLKDVARDLLLTFARQGINSAFGNIFAGLGGSFGGGRAGGGPVSAGKSYLVGERGPELFTPGASGGITPNGAMGGSGGDTFNQSIQFSGMSPSDRSWVRAQMQRLKSETVALVERRQKGRVRGRSDAAFAA